MEKETNYNKFKFFEFNREISQAHVEKIKKSIKENGYLHSKPITVNKDFYITDGQHRFIACKQMNLPIFYVVEDCTDNKLIINLNATNKNWTMKDYVKFYAISEQKQDFIRLLTTSNMLNVSILDVLTLSGFKQGENTTNKVRTGTLVFTDDNANKAYYNLQFVKKVLENIRFPYSVRIARGILDLDLLKNYSRDRLLVQTLNYSTKAYKCQSYIDYTNMFIEIYNYNVKSKNNLLKKETNQNSNRRHSEY